jgi:hypothetical protein
MNVSDSSWSGNMVPGSIGVATVGSYSLSLTCNHARKPELLPGLGSKKLRLSSELLRI